MGLLSQGMDSLTLRGKSRRASAASTASSAGAGAAGGVGGMTAMTGAGAGGKDDKEGQIDDGDPNDTSTLDKEEGNVLMAIIQQLRPGMDLSKIALPTFVLEPRSLLERITDFFSHPELIFGAGAEQDPKARFLKVMTYYLSGWHIKPKGVKKPYNPVLGEFFRCSYFYPDGSEGFYVAEQVSHHPPVSAFFYVSPQNGLLITGELKPKSKFLGNSAATIMEGEDRIRLLDRPEDGEYAISMPNTYARGILFGKMLLELCDVSTIENTTTDFHCDVDFKAKGWISGGYNVIAGKVTGPGRSTVGDISGHWSSQIEFSDKKSGEKKVVFDPAKARTVPKSVLPESEQEEFESRRLWTRLTEAIKSADMYAATEAKTAVEDHQRQLVKQREANGQGPPEPRFFKHVAGDKWMPKIDVDSLPKDRKEMEDKVRQWIFGDNPPKRGTASASGSNPQSPAPKQSTSQAQSPAVAQPAQTQSVPQAQGSSGTASSEQSSVVSPPASTTAPGPPAAGPKFDHPV